MKEKRSSGSRKRTLASILGLIMVVGITIAGTLAFMNAVSNEKKNTFTGTNDIKLYLEEPNYNIDEAGNVKWENQLDPREYIPGESYDKDPTLYNTSDSQTLKADG